jgi:hypothetical protein
MFILKKNNWPYYTGICPRFALEGRCSGVYANFKGGSLRVHLWEDSDGHPSGRDYHSDYSSIRRNESRRSGNGLQKS